MFVRNYKEIDRLIQSYVYIEKGNTMEFEGEKSIIVKLELEHKMPEKLYVEFTKKV